MKIIKSVSLSLALALPGAVNAEKLTVAWGPNPQTPQMDTAIAKGYFEEAGLDVEFIAFRSGRAGFEAMMGGQVDVTFQAEFPAAVGALIGQDFFVIGDLARFSGSRVIVNAASAKVETPADLAGLKIGTTIGTNVNFFLDTVLSDAGVEAEIVSAAPPDLVPALARGDVDAIVPFPTFYQSAAEALGDDYSELRVPGYQVHYIMTTTPEMVNERTDELDAFLAALAKADADVQADRDAAMDTIVESMAGAVSKETLMTMWPDVDISLILDVGLAELLVDEGRWILDQGVVNGEPFTTEEMLAKFYADGLRAAAPEAVNLP